MRKFIEMTKRHNNRNGLEFLSMLFALALIGIIAVLGTRSYTSAMDGAELSRAKSDMRLIADAANQYRADMGPDSLATISGGKDKWCAALKSTTTTNPEGMAVGPWLGTCPNPPHNGGSYTISALTNYTADVTYTYSGGSLKLSDIANGPAASSSGSGSGSGTP